MGGEAPDADWKTVPKWVALKRLKNEGREDAFLAMKTTIYGQMIADKRAKVPGVVVSRDAAFYKALEKFPPLE